MNEIYSHFLEFIEKELEVIEYHSKISFFILWRSIEIKLKCIMIR